MLPPFSVTDDSPTVNIPDILALPPTSSACRATVVPIPTLPDSKVILNAVVPKPTFQGFIRTTVLPTPAAP